MNSVKYRFPIARVPDMLARTSKMEKQAQRLGIPFPTITVGDPYRVKTYEVDHMGDPVYVWKRDVLVEGEGIDRPVSYGGWEILGAFNHEYEAGVVANLLSEDVKPEYKERFTACNLSLCEHCNQFRRRNNTYVIRNEETREQMAVGSSCMANFVPHKASLDRVISYYQTFSETMGEFDPESERAYYNQYADNEKFLRIAAAVYISKELPWRSPEFHVAVDGIYSEGPQSSYFYIIGDYAAKVDGFLEGMDAFIDSLFNSTNEFSHKLSVIYKSGYHRPQDSWALVWAVHLWAKECEDNAQKATDANVYLGEVGDRIEAVAVFVGDSFLYSSDYGDMYLYTFKTAEGNTITWVTGPKDFNKGIQHSIRSKVKAHTDFKGIKQTQLIRPTIKEITP